MTVSSVSTYYTVYSHLITILQQDAKKMAASL